MNAAYTQNDTTVRRCLLFIRIFFSCSITGNHCLEITPACTNDLCNVNDEEKYVPDSKHKMFCARPFIASAQPCKKFELHRFVNGKTGEHRADSHYDHSGVCDLLR